MQYMIDHIYKYDKMESRSFRKLSVIWANSTHIANKKMPKKAIKIKEVQPNTNRLLEQQIRVYTNPVDGLLVVEIIGLLMDKGAFIFIFTLTGTLLQMINVTEVRTFVDISSQPNGKYLMNVQVGTGVSTWKIMK